MEKIKIDLCIGTHCFIMGASDLMILEDKLPFELKDKIEVHGQTCMQFCKQMANKSKPPFVKINGKVFGEANVASITEELYKIVDSQN